MGAKKYTLRPKQERQLEQLGNNLKLARLRRRLSASLVAERANIGRTTLWHIEKGSEQVSIGALLRVLTALNLDEDLLAVAKDDVLGRKLQDIGIKTPKRAPRKRSR